MFTLKMANVLCVYDVPSILSIMTPPNTLSVIFPKYLLHNDFQEVLSDKRGEGEEQVVHAVVTMESY